MLTDSRVHSILPGGSVATNFSRFWSIGQVLYIWGWKCALPSMIASYDIQQKVVESQPDSKISALATTVNFFPWRDLRAIIADVDNANIHEQVQSMRSNFQRINQSFQLLNQPRRAALCTGQFLFARKAASVWRRICFWAQMGRKPNENVHNREESSNEFGDVLFENSCRQLISSTTAPQRSRGHISLSLLLELR